MRNLITLIIASAMIFSSCIKTPKPVTYSVAIEKDNDLLASVKIDEVTYSFTDREFVKEVVVKDVDVIDVWAQYEPSSGKRIQIIVSGDDGSYIKDVSGIDYCCMFLEHDKVTPQSYGAGTGGSSNGNGSHYCGYPTQAGGHCRRLVAGSTGYCWQHR